MGFKMLQPEHEEGNICATMNFVAVQYSLLNLGQICSIQSQGFLYIYIYIYTHTHTHTYIYVYICIYSTRDYVRIF